jgi:glycosyltransferase involved in cell wall biosynthesis
MKRRKLLLVTYHFPPSAASGSFRLLGFARHLPKFGWDPVVVAPPRGLFEPVDEELGRQVPPETVAYSVPHPRGLFARALRRLGLARDALWLPRALRACARAVRTHRPAAVLTSGPPHFVHLLGRALKRIYGLPWLADFRDLWVASTPRAQNRSLFARWEALCERGVMRDADVLIANAPRATRGLRNAFPKYADKTVTLTNGYDPEAFPAPTRGASDGPLTLLHAGELYSGRNPLPLLDGLAALRRGQPLGRPVRLVFLGEVNVYGETLGEEARRRGLEGLVTIEPQVGYGEAIQRMARADLLLLLDAPGRKQGVPAKLYEYLGARRPVLALAEPDGDTAWALRESGVLHRTALPNDPAATERALRELTEAVREGAPVSAERPVRAFTRASLAGELAGLLETCLAPAAEAFPRGAVRLEGANGWGR